MNSENNSKIFEVTNKYEYFFSLFMNQINTSTHSGSDTAHTFITLTLNTEMLKIIVQNAA